MALETLARLHKEGLHADQLKSSQSYMLGQFPPSIETNGQIAARLADMLFHGLGPEDVNEYAARVTKVDAAAVRSTIEQSFPQPDNLVIVLIGDAAKIRDAVRKYGPVTEMKITDPRFAPAAK
jgi:predicted Zn-dependent peptidase